MHYRLNFLSTAADKQKRRRIRRLTGITYAIIWIFSGYVFFQVYTTQRFMTNIHEARTLTVEKKISNIEPRVLFLENKIAERNRLRNQASLYVQENNRPAVWYARLVEFARVLPPELVLTQISFKPRVISEKDKPEIIISGYIIIEKEEQDIFAVDNLRAVLAESLPTRFTYSKLAVENNYVYKEEEKLKLVFSLGYYR